MALPFLYEIIVVLFFTLSEPLIEVYEETTKKEVLRLGRTSFCCKITGEAILVQHLRDR